ncbi:hypothetical protein [Magnetospirillum gryphiswaldense]|uniref:Secreted protein n=1 Tax=Magnetospirillum gryphiswaldense TaxID=55518 RepID=A4TW67_9PROT|nr:hypothetical protein [Magnetospirillum gryphiswaldense]AVM75962.1 hypothetical protein MSR1_35000 [Magnetospirillum gryphiswaldense MSR-1]AVM79865.1 hypothetical protein MSR1L_35000 [Magnetospirillum gryphiswaldense]CAM74874.1 conserved hypothetical protein [Magnetospirillum gryphiswaldense MSR-1]
MPRASWVLVLVGLFLSACYQVSPPVVENGSALPGWRDGVYGRDDGTQVDIRWDGDQSGFVIGAGGVARLEPLANGLYLVDYQAERRITLLARRADNGDVIFVQPEAEAERHWLSSHQLNVRPGPIPRLEGGAAAIRRYFTDLARHVPATELHEAARLRWLHS